LERCHSEIWEGFFSYREKENFCVCSIFFISHTQPHTHTANFHPSIEYDKIPLCENQITEENENSMLVCNQSIYMIKRFFCCCCCRQPLPFLLFTALIFLLAIDCLLLLLLESMHIVSEMLTYYSHSLYFHPRLSSI
jgi:hypothetical protein